MKNSENDMSAPFLRWAGSKRWFLPQLRSLMPSTFGSYFEPFLGSGAAFFTVADGHDSHLADTIPGLVNCYEQVRDQPIEIAALIQSWPTDATSYYEIRAESFEDPLPMAAQFLYLNRLCFNGLYRENSSGRFNVPYGRPKNTSMLSAEKLAAVAARLKKNVTIVCGDFEETLAGCQKGDLVYLDPPYVAGHRTNGFADYNSKIFSWADQQRLARIFIELDDKGVFVVQTNADHSTVRDLYSGYEPASIARYSSMAATASRRGSSSELLMVGRSLREAVKRSRT